MGKFKLIIVLLIMMILCVDTVNAEDYDNMCCEYYNSSDNTTLKVIIMDSASVNIVFDNKSYIVNKNSQNNKDFIDNVYYSKICPSVVSYDFNGDLVANSNNGSAIFVKKAEYLGNSTGDREGEVNSEYAPLWNGNLSKKSNDSLENVVVLLNEKVLKPLRYIVPILFLILTSFDFAKSIFSDDKNGIGKARNNLFRRIIISIIFFFIPMIVESLMTLFDITR